MKRKLLALLLALSLLTGLALPALAAETATLIRLTKTTGTVEISKSSGKSVSLLQNMRLYNGYHVTTDEESYAWINLDDSKLLKEDAESEVELRKDGKKLEVQLSSGNLFFDVAKPLEDDESMNIRTSTTVVGIRGTSGWVEVVNGWTTRISVLEGTVECSVADSVTGQIKAEEVHGGETATCVVYPREQDRDKCDIIREKFTVDDIPGFVLTDLVRDMALCDKIEEATGLDIPRDLASAAGGDPSGREPDRERATQEVLDEADRREDADEDALHEKLEEIEKELEKQPDSVSSSKPIEKPAPPAPSDSGSDRDDDSDSSGGNSGGGTTPTPDPAAHTITFNANGGTASSASASTGAGGTLASLPSASYGGLTFDGWYTALTGGTKVDETTAFTADATVYAHWSGWSLDGGVLTIAGTGPMGDYPGISDPYDGVWNTAPWCGIENTNYEKIQTVVIKEGVTSIGEGAFYICYNMTSVTIPSSVTSIGDNAFEQCDGLTSVEIPSSVTSIGNEAFWSCIGLTSVTIPSSVASIGNDAFCYCGNLTSVEISPGVASIGDRAFGYCGLTSVAIPASVTSLDSGAFIGCRGLTEIVVDGASSSYCTVNGAVLDKNQTTMVRCPEGYPASTYEIPSSVTVIGEEAFYDCDSLTSMEIPYGVTSIGNYAFAHCEFTSVTIPNSVTSIGDGAFDGCDSLTTLEIPASVTSIGDRAFSQCTDLTRLEIPSSVTSIGYAAFSRCTGLTSVEIPSSVTIIEDQIFSGCTSLASVRIPSGVTSIGVGAFSDCTSLTSIEIPSTVTNMKDSPFTGSGLTVINFTGTQAQWNAMSKSYNPVPSTVTVIHCADGDITP